VGICGGFVLEKSSAILEVLGGYHMKKIKKSILGLGLAFAALCGVGQVAGMAPEEEMREEEVLPEVIVQKVQELIDYAIPTAQQPVARTISGAATEELREAMPKDPIMRQAVQEIIKEERALPNSLHNVMDCIGREIDFATAESTLTEPQKNRLDQWAQARMMGRQSALGAQRLTTSQKSRLSGATAAWLKTIMLKAFPRAILNGIEQMVPEAVAADWQNPVEQKVACIIHTRSALLVDLACKLIEQPKLLTSHMRQAILERVLATMHHPRMLKAIRMILPTLENASDDEMRKAITDTIEQEKLVEKEHPDCMQNALTSALSNSAEEWMRAEVRRAMLGGIEEAIPVNIRQEMEEEEVQRLQEEVLASNDMFQEVSDRIVRKMNQGKEGAKMIRCLLICIIQQTDRAQINPYGALLILACGGNGDLWYDDDDTSKYFPQMLLWRRAFGESQEKRDEASAQLRTVLYEKIKHEDSTLINRIHVAVTNNERIQNAIWEYRTRLLTNATFLAAGISAVSSLWNK